MYHVTITIANLALTHLDYLSVGRAPARLRRLERRCEMARKALRIRYGPQGLWEGQDGPVCDSGMGRGGAGAGEDEYGER